MEARDGLQEDGLQEDGLQEDGLQEDGLQEDDLDDLLPEDLQSHTKAPRYPLATRKELTPAQKKAEKRQKEAKQKKAEADRLARAEAQRLAQIVNLHIAGFSLAQIGASIGASADEVDRLLSRDTARYVRTQPALRTYVRNYISEKYAALLEADWSAASDETHPAKLENQDRVIRILERMGKLHGAEAPVQSEVKVEAAPEAVEKLVSRLAAAQGLDYDTNIFDDVVDAEVISDEVSAAVAQTKEATVVSGNAVEQPQEGDAPDGF